MDTHGMTRRTFVAGTAALGSAALALPTLGCSGGDGSSDEKVFRWAQSDPQLPLDPQRSTTPSSLNVADAVCDSLVYWNDALELVPVLAAEMPTWSDDGLTLTVKLKEGIKFHDGSDFTADDVKFTFERIYKPETASLVTNYYRHIKGADEMLAGKADSLEGLVVVDDYTVEFHLVEPYAQFLSNLGFSYGDIYPRKACEEAGADWGLNGNLVGTGQYKLVSDDGSTVVLEANEEWHAGEPNLDRINISYIDDVGTKMISFANGELDACDLDASLLEQYQDDPEVGEKIHYADTLGTYFVVLNLKDERFQDVRVREALSLAIDRQSLVDSVMCGAAKPATCFLAPAIPGSLGEDAEVFAYDPDRARKLLEEAGATDLSITFTTRQLTASQTTAIQAMWEEVGVTAEIVQVDQGTFTSDQAAGNLECYIQNWYPFYPDADNNMYSFFYSTQAATKSSFYDNPDFDKLMDQGRVELDDDARAEIYRRADELLTHEDYACLPLFWPQMQYVATDEVKMDPRNITYHFNEIEMS